MNELIINENLIHNLINKSSKDKEYIRDILNKSLELKGLDLEEVAILLNINDEELKELLFENALKIKELIYGKRLVLFAPLYISNYCSNNCLYCGFRVENKDIHRIKLTLDEIKEETISILEQGHKRVLMLMGEHHKDCTLEYFIEAIKTVYSAKDSKGNSIRRVNLEIAPLTDEEFKQLSQIPIGTYTVFQETYHRETYQKVHPSGKKSDYDWRLSTMDRALSNGLHDVGIGALFGLYDFRFEVLALISHSNHLDKTYGVGPHTISIPRIKPAQNAPFSHYISYAVSDEDFKKLIAVLRCAVPYTGMILSTREPAELRNELFNLGISQISAGSRTNPGGYKQRLSYTDEDTQFHLNDCRTSGETIHDVIKFGFIPSFCTSCYRLGRVGGDFMEQAKPGLIKLFCHPNALITLKEYLMDYADEETKILGEKLISLELENFDNDALKRKSIEILSKIENGERDIYI